MRGYEILSEMKSLEDDKYTFIEIDHVRRTRITLKHLQTLRKTRSMEELEHSLRSVDVARIYGKLNEEM